MTMTVMKTMWRWSLRHGLALDGRASQGSVRSCKLYLCVFGAWRGLTAWGPTVTCHPRPWTISTDDDPPERALTHGKKSGSHHSQAGFGGNHVLFWVYTLGDNKVRDSSMSLAWGTSWTSTWEAIIILEPSRTWMHTPGPRIASAVVWGGCGLCFWIGGTRCLAKLPAATHYKEVLPVLGHLWSGGMPGAAAHQCNHLCHIPWPPVSVQQPELLPWQVDQVHMGPGGYRGCQDHGRPQVVLSHSLGIVWGTGQLDEMPVSSLFQWWPLWPASDQALPGHNLQGQGTHLAPVLLQLRESCISKASVVCSVKLILAEETRYVFPTYWSKYQRISDFSLKNHKELKC